MSIPQPTSTGGDLGERTRDLLRRAQTGDPDAREKLAEQYLEPLTRWVSFRIPAYARRRLDPEDLVQNALMSSFKNLERFDPDQQGSFLGYLRQALINQIRDEARRVKARPSEGALSEFIRANVSSPLEIAMGQETVERYEAALMTLSPADREAVTMRVDLDFTYPQIASALGNVTPNAVRMRIIRSILRLAEILHE